MSNTQKCLTDPVQLTQALIRRPSVTPADEGAMDVVQGWLEDLGFSCTRLKYAEIENLYARRGSASPNLCFAGHTDVVPDGERAGWRCDPFAGEIKDGILTGRGAVDMKGGIAAWIAAVARLENTPGSLSFLITGDEEGVATDGTVKVVEWLKTQGEVIDHCIVGEPTSSAVLGDMIKVGRRGSINATITVTGKQGHVAYPQRALNPVPVLVDIMQVLNARVLDEGYERFLPSNLEITTFDVGNATTNLIPQKATGRVNIRFNPTHSGQSLADWMRGVCDEFAHKTGAQVEFKPTISGEAFLTEGGPFVEVILSAIREVLGTDADPSTTGGTSDARFIRSLCPVVEFGLVGQTMHQVNESTPVADLENLTRVYQRLIELYFARFAA
ncbi:succinyl-diaminopimelate desuccinylase [Asticcacaulis sp. SL142]|uniref:succinyl-diaminopimelate desuccinylase n=1 Tax=Asticcacaulis sp. SL142 TaxID=2995155 RepID=UPI003B63D4A8